MKKYVAGICAMIIGTALAFGSSAFKNAGARHDTDKFWVLKSGTTASTSESAYKEGTDNCERDVHFCGFYAPANSSGIEPTIPSTGSLQNDLTNLSVDNNTPYNTSMKISFSDND